MPRLIVDDAGKRKAFRVTQGRLSVGSGADAKLALTASGVEEQHANILVSPEGVRVQVLAPVTVSGERVEGGVIDLDFGAKLLIGSATISVEADAPEEGAKQGRSAKGASGKSAGASRSGGSRGRSGATGAKSGSGGRSAAGGKRRSGAAASGGRGSRRGGGAAEKQGLPPAAKFGGIVVVLALGVYIFSSMGSSSAAANNMTAAQESLESGNLASARKLMERIDRSDLDGDVRDRFDGIMSELEEREAYKAEAGVRMDAMTYINEEVDKLIERQFKSETPEKPKVRLLLERIADFKTTFPNYASDVWMTDTTYVADYERLKTVEQQYGAMANLNEAYTLEDAVFRAYFFLEKSPRRYQLVMPVIDAALTATSDEYDVEALNELKTRLSEEQKAYADERLQKARERYEQEDSDIGTAARILMTDIQTLTDTVLIDRAATVLVGMDRIDEVFRGMRDGSSDVSRAELALLQDRIPRIRDYIRANLNDDEEPASE
ncbi:MAG: FHA domain-containing protein [Planctomycetota bacterium]|jgi:hypothetical protein